MGFKLGQQLIDILRNKKKDRRSKEFNMLMSFNTREFNALKNELNRLQEELDQLKYIHLPALKQHAETFSKYKNIYQGKDIVVVGSGPTLHNYTMLKDAIHIGVNHTFTVDKLNLDYLFIQDYLNLNKTEQEKNSQKIANNYHKDTCKKMYGVHYLERINIPEENVCEANAERYYFLNHFYPSTPYATFSSDITTRPLNEWGSVIFAAMEFALYTHPKRIFLVGCDCTAKGHIYWKDRNASELVYDRIYYGWERIKDFAHFHYPDTEIISINPVRLKGLFTDVYTESYVNSHEELNKDEITIIS